MNHFRMTMLAAIVAATTGCATNSYVDEQLAVLQARQDTQEARLNAQDQRLEELSVTAIQALERAVDAGVLAEGKFLYSVVMNEDVSFDSGISSLSDATRDKLSGLARQLKADNRNVYLEIQGHTDSTGEEAHNQRLGLARADAVRHFLHEQGIALDRMATISYGESIPAESNDSAQGRSRNRRVEIVVLD